MPYIKQEIKDALHHGANPHNAGALTYMFTQALIHNDPSDVGDALENVIQKYYVACNEVFRYANYCTIMGSLTCAQYEFVRRRIQERGRKRKPPIPGDLQRVAAIKDYIKNYYPKHVAPYEDTKLAENGDVF